MVPMLGCAQFLYWDYHNITTDTSLSGAYPAMAVDATGKIHVSYWHQAEDRLIYAFKAPGDVQWTREYVDVSHANGFRSAIALDASFRPHIVYQENVNWVVQMRYATRASNGVWTVEQIPGNPVRGWGAYGPNAVITLKERIKHSLDILIDENQKPQIVFFDGWMQVDAFPECSPGSQYGFRLQQAVKPSGGSWLVRDFGEVTDIKWSCSTPDNPSLLPRGDRYGEYCSLVQRQDNTAEVFALSRFNNRLISFRNTLPGLDTVWQRTDVDSMNRLLPGWDWATRYYTIEGISAYVGANDDVHLAYSSSLFYGENFCCTAFTNDLVYARVKPDTILYHSFGIGTYRNYTDMVTLNDSVYFSYADLNQAQILLQASTDGGLNWVQDTVMTGIAIHASPTTIVGDSLLVLVYVADRDELVLNKRHLSGGEWRREVVNASDYSGASIDGYLHLNGGDTVVTSFYNDRNSGELFYASTSSSNGFNFAAPSLVPNTGHVSVLSAARRPNGGAVVAYAGWPNDELRVVMGSPGNWTMSVVDTTANVQYVDVQVSGADTVHVAYYVGGDTCLRHAKRHGSGANWVRDVVTCDSMVVGEFLSLALNAAGQPSIAFYASGTRALKYAAWNPGLQSWEVDSVHGGTASAVGKYAALRMDGAGLPKVAYLDEQSTAVWLAEKDGAGVWTHTLVDSVPVTNIGRPIDLEIDGFGKVWVAYNYFSNFEKVKLMHRDSVWREVAVGTQGRIANAFMFRIFGGGLYLLGRKMELQNTGVAMIRAARGVYVQAEAPLVIRENLSVSQYPNPFTEATTFQIEVKQAGEFELVVQDLYGRDVVRVMPMRKLGVGQHTFTWDAGGIPAGVYFYTVRGSGGAMTGKMVLSR